MNGGSAAFEQKWLSQVDPAVVKELIDFLSGVATPGD